VNHARLTFAAWLGKVLLVRNEKTSGPPGALRVLSLYGSAGDTHTIVTRGDVFEIYHGREVMCMYSVTNEDMLSIARFTLRWWVAGTWCSIKLRLWGWSQRQFNIHLR